jgi:hypothetical protein
MDSSETCRAACSDARWPYCCINSIAARKMSFGSVGGEAIADTLSRPASGCKPRPIGGRRSPTGTLPRPGPARGRRTPGRAARPGYATLSGRPSRRRSQDSRTNRWARRGVEGFWGGKAVRAQFGIARAFRSGAAARRASLGLRLCNHGESGAFGADKEGRCLPIRWLMADPRTL